MFDKKTIEICKSNYNGKRNSKIIKYRKIKHNDLQKILCTIKHNITQNVIYRI